MKNVRTLPQELKHLMLAAPKLTLGVAESLTCGNLQAKIGSVSGASEFFCGGLTAYALEQKVRHLGVERAQAEAVNSVSAPVAEQMALGASRLFGTDLGLATTGYAEPDPGRNVREPFAFWALAHVRPGKETLVFSGRIECVGASRTEAQQWVADAALGELVGYLAKLRA
ncbi:MAG: nicotinamide-nucleotide amidohydrolase family protein [Nibricoccus sp.]